jgi:secreted trypsin-like serine protease
MQATIGLLLALGVCCFGTDMNINRRIVGGDFSDKNQFPHQVAILTNGRFYCGGSIISPDWVLTAAHCLADPNGMLVVLQVMCVNIEFYFAASSN